MNKLRKQREKRAFGKLFCPALPWVQMHFIFSDDVHILYLFCNVKKLQYYLKRAETSVILIVLMVTSVKYTLMYMWLFLTQHEKLYLGQWLYITKVYLGQWLFITKVYLGQWLYITKLYLGQWLFITKLYLGQWLYITKVYLGQWLLIAKLYLGQWLYITKLYLGQWLFITKLYLGQWLFIT